ncbi:MAG: SEC-C domain-containing protein [Lactococcus lactis]|nr:SEC-C domain-containing protein [Lactococcus lactis]
MIELSCVRKELTSVGGIKINSIIETSTSSIIVYFHFDARISINGAEYLLNHNIQMEIPKIYPCELPIVFEFGEKQIKNFPHINPDVKGTFCLGTEMDIRRILKPDYLLGKYVHLIAEFLGTYKYYDEYGVFPYGDRGHGTVGIIETYKDIFSVSTKQQVLNLMMIDKLKNSYRNKKCPCNSGVKFKSCHWKTMSIIFKNPLEYSQMKKDYVQINGG